MAFGGVKPDIHQHGSQNGSFVAAAHRRELRSGRKKPTEGQFARLLSRRDWQGEFVPTHKSAFAQEKAASERQQEWCCQSELGDTAFAGTGFRGAAVLGAGALVFGGLYGSVPPETRIASHQSSCVGEMTCRVRVPSGLETISVLTVLPLVYFESYDPPPLADEPSPVKPFP